MHDTTDVLFFIHDTHVMAIKRITKLAKVMSALNPHAGRCTQLCHPSTAALIPTVTQKPRMMNIWRHTHTNTPVRTSGRTVKMGTKNRPGSGGKGGAVQPLASARIGGACSCGVSRFLGSRRYLTMPIVS